MSKRLAESFADLLQMEMALGSRLRGKRSAIIDLGGLKIPFELRIADAGQLGEKGGVDTVVLCQGPGSFALMLAHAYLNRCFYAYPLDVRQLPGRVERGFFKKCGAKSLEELEATLKNAIRATFEVEGPKGEWRTIR